ncbi:MAG: GNAT family N-acetyltransferase [Candidatus Helarchaeota archaeon]
MNLFEDITIVRATLKDIDGIRELTKQLCRNLGKKFNEERFLHGIKNRLEDNIQKYGYFIAKKGDKIVGMVFAEISEIPDKMNEKQLEGFLKTVVVDEAYRGLKVGEKILRTAINYLKEKNIKIIKTNVHKKAEAALNLYKKFGFIGEFGLEPFKRFVLKL